MTASIANANESVLAAAVWQCYDLFQKTKQIISKI